MTKIFHILHPKKSNWRQCWRQPQTLYIYQNSSNPLNLTGQAFRRKKSHSKEWQKWAHPAFAFEKPGGFSIANLGCIIRCADYLASAVTFAISFGNSFRYLGLKRLRCKRFGQGLNLSFSSLMIWPIKKTTVKVAFFIGPTRT